MSPVRRDAPALGAACLLLALAPAPAARATEGGASFYVQGLQGDFGAGLIGPPGLYVRQDVALWDVSAGLRPVGGRASLGTDLRAWLGVTRLAYAYDGELFGARMMSAAAIPFAFDIQATGTAAGFGQQAFGDAQASGLGDIYVAPLRLGWSAGHHHLVVSPGIFMPTGGYSTDRIVNQGKNRWGFDLSVAYTWLDPERGHEFSVTGGYLINTRNNATGYESGNEIHVDGLLAQYLSPRFGLAAVGYWYQQVTDDGGVQPPPFTDRGFRGSGYGLGAAAIARPSLFGRDVTVIGKWIHDLEAENRFRGDIYTFSVAFAF